MNYKQTTTQSRGITMKNKKLNPNTIKNLFIEINKMNRTIESLMDKLPDGPGYVVRETPEWFIANKCDTIELVTKEYIKWYYTMGGYWIDNPTLIVRYNTWGKKLINDLKAIINTINK